VHGAKPGVIRAFAFVGQAMKLEVTTNVYDVIRELDAARREMRPAVVRALNRMIDQVKVRAAREVRAAGYKLKISDIKSAIRINRASTGRLRADAIASGRPIPLIKYGARQTAAGVTVDVLNGRKLIAHAFIATTSNGTPQVFVRKPGAKHRKVTKGGKAVWTALPIDKKYGPSIPDALANKAVERALLALIEERFPAILAHEHAWLTRRLDRLPSNPTD
jgi:hypothetical protein